MSALSRTTVVVPCRDEAGAIGSVVSDLRAAGATWVIVVDNGSRDDTAEVAARAGAQVVRADRAGYGWACLAGVAAAGGSDLVGFIDGDGSFAAEDLARLAGIVASGEADMALGARRRCAMAFHQRVGNALTLALLRLLYRLTLPDIMPLRVVRGDLLRALDMRGSRYQWLVEMLCKATRRGARVAVVRVRYGPRRSGESKVTGSGRQSLLVGADFLRALWMFRTW